MLLELPLADEIDEMATDRPSLIVRRFEYELTDRRIDLEYQPCKGEALFVTDCMRGVALVKSDGAKMWTLPSGRIDVNESPEAAARRIAVERCCIRLGEVDLRALYDVTRHYENISVKRLFVIFRAEVEDFHSGGGRMPDTVCTFHSSDLGDLVCEEIDSQAITDCLGK